MPTKTQAKTAIDNAAVGAKADIDNTLPVGVNIIDGRIDFNPTRYVFKMDAGNSLTTAQSWRDTILTNLDTQVRTHTVVQVLGRRVGDLDRVVVVHTVLADYIIINF